MLQHKKTIDKNELNKQFQDFFKRIKLRARFKNKENNHFCSKEDRFKTSTTKNWVLTNSHHRTETFIEATHTGAKEKIKKATIKIF